jgi:lysophospholipase L1-like esterase
MIAKAQFLVKDVMLVSVFPIKEKHDRSNNYLLPEDLTVYAVIVKKVCEEENIPYMDLYNEWLGKNYEQFLSLDGVHINTKGHEMIFEKLKEFLEKMYS